MVAIGLFEREQRVADGEKLRRLRAIAQLDDADLRKFGRWCRRYLNKWGQVPNASSFRVESGVRQDIGPPKEPDT